MFITCRLIEITKMSTKGRKARDLCRGNSLQQASLRVISQFLISLHPRSIAKSCNRFFFRSNYVLYTRSHQFQPSFVTRHFEQMSLVRLADEVILIILQYVDDSWKSRVYRDIDTRTKTRIRDLYSLCLSCRKLSRLATPFLFSVFDTGESGGVYRLFIRSIIEHSELAGMVRFVNSDLLFERNDSRYVEEEPSLEIAQAFVQAAERIPTLGQRDNTKWLEDLSLGSKDAEVALLLCLTKNVEALDLRLPSFETKLHILNVVLEAGFQPSALSHQFPLLQRIRADKYIDMDGFTAEFFMPYFCLPSLRIIEGWHVSSEKPINFQWPIATSNVESIELLAAHIAGNTLVQMVSACKALKRFVCQIGRQKIPTLTTRDIGAALKSQKHSLEVLSLIAHWGPEVLENLDSFRPLPTLKNFDKLIEVSISFIFLIGSEPYAYINPPSPTKLVEMLPFSLKSLVIHGLGTSNLSSMIDSLVTLANSCNEDFAELRFVELRVVDLTRAAGINLDKRARLSEAFESTDVALRIV